VRLQEQAIEVRGSRPPNLFQLNSLQLCQTLRRFNDAHWFISLTAKRNGRQIWTVGLNQQPIQGQSTRNLAQVIGLLERQITAKEMKKPSSIVLRAIGRLPPKQCITPPYS
jgi:hypothetical protein